MTTPIQGSGSGSQPEPMSKIPPGYKSWEEMFAKTGHPLNSKELMQIMGGIEHYMTLIINQQTQSWKRTQEQMRKSIEGKG